MVPFAVAYVWLRLYDIATRGQLEALFAFDLYSVMALLEFELKSEKVKTAAPAGQLVVLGDRDELIRVFENLVENALKYAASGKRVDIKLALGQGAGGNQEARVAVRDYGPGIAPEHLPRLTERFYRVDVSESRAQGGTGLGLALAKHILNRHGGRLTIESVLGQGATFVAHLPTAAVGPGESSRSPARTA